MLLPSILWNLSLRADLIICPLVNSREECEALGCKSVRFQDNPNGCMGFSFGYTEIVVDRTVDTTVATPEGAGLGIPAGAWPEGVGPATQRPAGGSPMRRSAVRCHLKKILIIVLFH